MVRELALSFCFVVADLSLTGGGTVFYLGYTIFTSFLFRYAISIVSSKAVARVKLWCYARRCSGYYSIIYLFLTDQLVHGGASRAIRNLRERLSNGAIFV